MPTGNIVKVSNVKKSYRNDLVKSTFDFNNDVVKENFNYKFDLPEKWNIGVIYGNSGSGKTTIAKTIFGEEIFKEHDFGNESVIDEMPDCSTFENIVNMFSSVGFGSVPSWLKSYHVLSNGEKMRVQLAYMLLSDKSIYCFDEFTSVVDRNVAKLLSFCVSKTIKRTDKKFVAITCHDDILDWIESDWTFCTDTMSYQARCLRRPKISIEITESNNRAWEYFKKHHYLNNDIGTSIKVMCAFIDNKPVGFISASHFPHPKTKNIAKLSRIVVLPDFQGIGIAKELIKCMTEYLLKMKKIIRITFSHHAMFKVFQKQIGYKLVHIGRMKENPKSKLKMVRSYNRNTFTFEYSGVN